MICPYQADCLQRLERDRRKESALCDVLYLNCKEYDKRQRKDAKEYYRRKDGHKYK
jgi:hypothetical protein